MRVLLSTKFYYPRGGDSIYTLGLEKLLNSKGHETLIFSMHHPESLPSPQSESWVSPIDFAESYLRRRPSDAIRVPLRSVLSYEAYRRLDALLDDERIDLAHLQNIHFHLTPSILYPLRKRNIPVIWTQHDYVVLCPAAHFLSHGKVCEACKNTRYYEAVWRKCQRGSLAASFLTAAASTVHRLLDVYRMVDRFVTPSRFMRDKFIEFGFPESQVVHVPNFIDFARIEPSPRERGYLLYVGRLSREKGIETLLRTVAGFPDLELRVAGDGPNADELKKEYGGLEHVHFLGWQDPEPLAALYAEAMGVVLPSECYENFPMVILEAYAHAKPVVASRLGALPENVREGETGLLFAPGNSAELRGRLEQLFRSPASAREMGLNGRKWLERDFSPEAHYLNLQRVYEEARAT